MTTRESLKEIIDDLPESLLPEAESILRGFAETESDPVQRALDDAPADDELLTEEARASITRGWESLREGRSIDDAALAKLLGA
ncbi:MAG: hypothetical protein WD557_15775 [Dehalococcoidia bacterium]